MPIIPNYSDIWSTISVLLVNEQSLNLIFSFCLILERSEDLINIKGKLIVKTFFSLIFTNSRFKILKKNRIVVYFTLSI